MEATPLKFKPDDNNEKALKGLLEAFGSTFSLQVITYAYHKAEKNADLAAEILYGKQGSSSTSPLFASNGEPIVLESSKPSYGDMYEKSRWTNGKSRASRQKFRPVSGGSISSIIGKDYVKPIPVANGHMGAKPMKLDAKEIPASTLWGEESKLNLSKSGDMQEGMEDFLFRMLGEGFQLERDVIHKVLDQCGYDMQKSMDKLLVLARVNSDEEDKSLSKGTEKTSDVHSDAEQPSRQLFPPLNSYGGGTNGTSILNGGRTPKQEEGNDMGKEVLVALFGGADKSETSRAKEKAQRRRRTSREVVTEPLRDFTVKHKAVSVDLKQDNKNVIDEEEEDAYQKLRRDVTEYRSTMKEYFKAAVTAFAKGDSDRANRLMDEGHFLNEKARKADEESSQKIFETKHVDTQNEVILDLHDHGAKEAISLLKCHLSTLSGISSIKYMKVILETDEEDPSKGARRKWVMRLLKKESIGWSEGGNAGTILIRVDNIKPKSLSFGK